jgi:ATP-dependent Clp protease protease subunit
MKPWYTFNNSAGADNSAAQLEIFDEIGPWGVTAKDFNRDLKGVSASVIDLYINSIGGDVFAGIGIYNQLRASGKTINVKVMGVAASIASVIAMAGTKISMPENSFMMVHNPWTFAMGNADELRDTADVLEKLGNSLTNIYVARTGKTEEEVKALLKAESYLSAAEAVELGFADEVIPEISASAKFDISDLPENVRAVFKAAAKPLAKKPELTQATEPVAGPDPEQITDAAVKAGLSDYAAVFALDASLTSTAKLDAELKRAKDVKSLCAVAKKPEAADQYIRARTSLTDVRASLCTALAEDDEKTNVDTAAKMKKEQEVKNLPPVSASLIWEARNKR